MLEKAMRDLKDAVEWFLEELAFPVIISSAMLLLSVGALIVILRFMGVLL